MIVYVTKKDKTVEVESDFPKHRGEYATSSLNKAVKLFRQEFNLARKAVLVLPREATAKVKVEPWRFCGICDKVTNGEAFNGEPLIHGICCKHCFSRFVLPIRLKIKALANEATDCRRQLAKAHEAMRPLAEYILEDKK